MDKANSKEANAQEGLPGNALPVRGKREKARWISAQLDALYPDPPVPLDHRNPYTLLIAVLLSAQCTDKRVNEVTPQLFERAADPWQMLALGETAVLKIIRPCGLGPQKARAIIGLSQQLIGRHLRAGGAEGAPVDLPRELTELEALPGVGHKTAQVVLAQAFGEPAFPVDTHIHRLAQRWGLSDGRSVASTEKSLKRLFPKASWNRLHLQIIFYGREHCHARRVCDGGPLGCGFCAVLNQGRKVPLSTRKP